jgi:hypothetical protein
MAIQKPSAKAATADSGSSMKYLIVGALILVAFFASYKIAQAGSSQTTNNLNAAAGSAQTAVNGGAVVASGPGGTGAGAAGGSCCGGSGGSVSGGAASGSAAQGAGGCCGGGANAPASAKAPKTAAVQGGVQKVSVDLSKGYYDPSNIVLKAGAPAEITFSQGSGCTAIVQSAQLNFNVDVSGGPQTVKLPALKAGTYQFYCGMQMVYGTITVK